MLQEIKKTNKKLDICIKINDPFISIITDLIIKSILELNENKKIESRCIIENTKDNVNYCKQLISTVDEVRHFDEIKGNFLINETTYAGISIAQEETLPLPQLIISDVQSFVEQQQFYFNLLWNNSIPVLQNMKVKWQNGREAVGREEKKRNTITAATTIEIGKKNRSALQSTRNIKKIGGFLS